MPCLRGISGPRPSAASLIVSLVAAGCGSPSGPSASPTPTPTATPPPGPVAGRYLLQIVPGPGGSTSRSPLSFPTVAAPAGTPPHPRVHGVAGGDTDGLNA